MFKKALVAAGLAFGLAVGVAGPTQAAGRDDSYIVVNVADQAGALRGTIGLKMSNRLTTYDVSIGTGARVEGPTSETYPFYPSQVRAGGGYCVWEQLYSRPTTSTGAHTTYEGERTYGKGQPSSWFSLQGWNYAEYFKTAPYEDKDYWSTLRIYAC